MPVVRYQIRNEYGLADPELYRAADREDPEALLEGVAMAGLVGVLRQLGDLAEFAAEIFHGLHEEVMATAARGHGLILRVQQLEAEFPAIEKDFLSQTSHSHLTCNAGIDWHPNLKVDQNVITQGDMPRFILDSYEECRGPPRLFVLDKFDIAGAGSCLKRYSDPSFFKMDLASSGTMEPEIQREKKARKVKRKGPRWKNGETPVTGTETHVNSMLQTVASDKLPDNIHVKRVKLKSRHLNDINASNERSYMARVLERHSPEHIVFCENSASHCHVKKSVDSSKSASEVHVVGIDASACNPTFRNRTPSGIPNTQEITVPYTNELDRHITKDGLKELSQKPNGELESFPSDFQKADEKKWLAHTELRNKECADSYSFEELEKIPVTFSDVDQKEPVSNAAMKTDGSTDGYISDDITSELDNYMDALATMESEVDTDTESRAKPGIDFVNIEHLGLDSDMNEEQQELQAHSLGRHSFENSSALVDHSIGQSSVSSETSSKDIAGLQLSQGNGSTYSVRTDLETDPSETTEIIDNITQIKNDISDVESSSPVVPKEICTLAVSDAPGLYEYKEASSSSTVTESNSTPFPFCPPIPGEVLSDTLYPNKVSSNFLESTEEIGRHLGSDLSPQAGPDEVQSAAVSINGVFSDNIESFEDYDKHSYDNSIHTDASCKSLSQTDADMLLPERVESSEILHHAIPNATDPNVTTSSIGISDDPIPVKPLPVEHVEELTADKLSNMADAPDKDTRLHDDAISENASIGNGADSIFLTVCKEELGRSMKQDPQPESGDCAEYIPVFPLENSFIDVQADGSLAAMENVVPPCESSECTVTIPENSGNIAKHEQHASDILPLGSQHFSDTDENHVDSAELLPSDSVRETIPDELSNASDHEVRDGLMPNGDLETSRCMTLKLDHFSQTTEYHLELPELLPSCSGEELPDILEARSNASDREEREEAMPIMRDNVDSAELLPSDFVRETIPDIPDVLSNASDHEVRDGLMPTGDLQTSRCMKLKLDHFSQTTEYHLESLEPSCSGQGLLDILETRSNASDREEREEDMPMRDRLNMPHDSSAANTGRVVLQAMLQEPHDVDSEELLPSCSENETTVEVLTNASDGQSRDLPMPVCDHDLHCSFMASNPPVDVDGHTPCRELISENPSTEDDSDEYISVKNCSGEASDIPIHVQEECISVNLVSDQHNLQINESSSTKDLLRLAVQTFPDITLSQENEDEVVLAPTDSKSGQQILNSLDNSGVGLVNHVYLTEPAQHAHVDMSPTNSDKDTTSLLESESHSNSKPSEENLFRCSNLQEECSSNDSTSYEHKLETTEASSQKDLTSFSDQGTPQVSVSDQEEVNAVFSPRDLKAEELVLGSPDHVGSEVLNCIGQTVSSEHAKLDLNPSIAKESTASPIEGEPYLASVQCHPYETASDISPFHSFHTEPPVPSEESSKLQAGRASSEITLQQMDRNLEHSDCQFASAQSFENSVTSNGCSPVDIVSQASEPDAHALVMDSQINSLEPESVLFQPSSELSISSLKSNFPPVSIATFPELSLPLRQPFEPSSDGPAFSFSPREGNALQSYVEEAPPLPPLPPLEWRMGKLQLGSMMSDGGMPESPNRHSPFMQLPAIDDSHGFARVEGEMMQPLNPFAEAPMLESKSHQHSYLTLEGESLHPLESSRTLPFFEDGRCKQGTISVDGKMGLPLPKSLIEESQIEDEKHLRGRGHGVFEKEMLPPSNPFAPVPASFIETFSSERDLLHPSNPFLYVSTMADEMFHYDYRDFRGENVQHLTTVGQVQFMDNVLPTTADEMPTRNPHSILNRPRDPLIEAVASHDKSTLRKVSELVRPSTKPKMDERETLLEQIRNKSFNLKPAVSAKPIIKGPSTNLKVAAILEKANAIRQAVGSDEDDDGDSWSDC